MAEDREWYRVPGVVPDYPNLESASEVAERMAAGTDDKVDVIRCTESVVRSYSRQITVTAEDVSKPA